MTLAQKLQRHRALFVENEEVSIPVKPAAVAEELLLSPTAPVEPSWAEPIPPPVAKRDWETMEEIPPTVYPELDFDPPPERRLPIYSLQQDLDFARRQQPQSMEEGVR